MWQWIKNVYYLSIKELRSLFGDLTLIGLVVIMFTFTIYSIAKGITTEVKNAPVAVLDEDHSTLSYQLHDVILPPYFKQVVEIERDGFACRKTAASAIVGGRHRNDPGRNRRHLPESNH